MSVRYVEVECLGAHELKTGIRFVVRDANGREASFPTPTSDYAVDALREMARTAGWRLLQVKVGSGFFPSNGATLIFRSRIRKARVKVHPGLAVAYAEKEGCPVLLDDRAFRLESLEWADVDFADEEIPETVQ